MRKSLRTKQMFSVLLSASVSAWVSAAPVMPVGPVQQRDTALAGALLQQRLVNEALSVTSAVIQDLEISTQRSGSLVSTVVLVDGEAWTIELQPNSVRSKDFQVLVQLDDSGTLVPYPAPPVQTYRGVVRERPDAHVRATLIEGKLEAVIYTPEVVFGIQPLSGLNISGNPMAHAVYRASDWVNTENFSCGTTDAHGAAGAAGANNPKGGLQIGDVEPLQSLAPVPGIGQNVAGTGLKVTDLAFDSDFEFYQLNGSNVAAVVTDIENIVNGVAPLYEVPAILITYEITTVIVRTVAGAPYTSTNPNTLLADQFQVHWNASPQSFIQRDTAHLFTGKEVDGNVIGIAYVGVICNSGFGYGLSQSRFTGNLAQRYALTAHEIGHNWNAPHCNDCVACADCCRIMCSGLGGCSGLITSFGCTETAVISSFRNAVGCLSDLADAQPVPFYEDFPSTTLNTSKWSYNRGGVIGAGAVNEPTAPNAMELDSDGVDIFRDDDFRTNFILLGGAPSGRLSFHTQHRGVESGEQLVVDYYTSTGHWLELTRLTSDGGMQNTFTFHNIPLPANALHNEFRARFHPEVNETNDDWYIDDIRVGTSCAINADCDDLLFCNGAETCAGNVCVLGTPPCLVMCRESDNTCVNCLADADCSDGVFCNGPEDCNAAGNCVDVADPCPLPGQPYCSESLDSCTQCLNAGHCIDVHFCNGSEVCNGSGACAAGADPCFPQACYEVTDACVPPGDMYGVLGSVNAIAASTVPFRVFAVSAYDVKNFQSAITITRTSGTMGTVSVVCPSGIAIDDARSDYIFFGLSDVPSSNCGQRRATSSLFSGSVFVDNDPVYLATYTLTVSADAEIGSTFSIAFTASPNSFLKNVNGVFHTVDLLGPYTLTIVDAICDPPSVSTLGSKHFDVNPAENLTSQALQLHSSDWLCVDDYVQADGSLGPVAVFQTAAAWGTITIDGESLVSDSSYTITADCGSLTSSPTAIASTPYGDVTGTSIVDVDDVVCLLEAFVGASLACNIVGADLAPCDPNGVVDVDDLIIVLDGFTGASDGCMPCE